MRAPSFDFGPELDGGEPARLRQAAEEVGFFYARHPLFDEERCGRALELAREFFALPAAEKEGAGIDRSAHFRGYSEMKNSRDWREQIHFGRETAAGGHRLAGPNLWPGDLRWRRRVLQLVADLELAGRAVLGALARSLEIPGDALLGAGEEAYLLLKMIHYLGTPDGVARSGVAPHVDFSWITVLLQDSTGGLDACTPSGEWVEVEPVAGTLVVNVGEILQFASGAYFLATPHRVTSRAGRRISLPFFLNPGLSRWVEPMGGGLRRERAPGVEREHVHRVMRVDEREAFCFGDAEWRRKGEGVWCRECVQAGKVK